MNDRVQTPANAFRHSLDVEALRQWVEQQRWYASKSRHVTGIEIDDGAVISEAATWSTSVTASTITPIFAPSDSRITVRVSSRSGAATLRRLRKSIRGTAAPWYWRTPSRNSGAFGSGAAGSWRRMRST